MYYKNYFNIMRLGL